MSTKVDLTSFESFCSHRWMVEVEQDYERRKMLAEAAASQVKRDLEALNRGRSDLIGRPYMTRIETRVKEKQSYLRKLFRMVCGREGTVTLTKKALLASCAGIGDVCGARFCVAYQDEVESVVRDVRTTLSRQGYATDLGTETKRADSDMLKDGDEYGYRSYHFYIVVPTEFNIYGDTAECLCEVQARSDLQHVWALRSHYLVYKELEGSEEAHRLREDLREISNHLEVADHFLTRLRDAAHEARSQVGHSKSRAAEDGQRARTKEARSGLE